MRYVTGYQEIVLNAFYDNPQADILCFQVEGIEGVFKKYASKKKRVGYIRGLKLASVEIAFRKDRIIEMGVNFAEDFGPGTEFYMGEDSIFIYDSLRKGLKIFYLPIKIADLHLGNSSWFTGFNEEYFKNKGATFARMSKFASLGLIIQFAFRKRKLYSENIGISRSIKFMYEGRKQFIKSRILER